MRRKGRELALKILYMLDIKEEKDLNNFDFSWENFSEDEKVKSFAEEIVRGVLKNIKKIDEIISKISLNWDIKRMSYIDRNILRIGTYEILFREDIPPAVSINEGIELAKEYGDEDSPKFVNGILHKIKELFRKGDAE